MKEKSIPFVAPRQAHFLLGILMGIHMITLAWTPFWISGLLEESHFERLPQLWCNIAGWKHIKLKLNIRKSCNFSISITTVLWKDQTIVLHFSSESTKGFYLATFFTAKRRVARSNRTKYWALMKNWTRNRLYHSRFGACKAGGRRIFLWFTKYTFQKI